MRVTRAVFWLPCLIAATAQAADQGTLRGIVFSSTGAPVPGIEIAVEIVAGSARHRAATLAPAKPVVPPAASPAGGAVTTSNHDGAFAFSLAPGSYRLAAAGQRAAGQALVVARETTEVLLTLRAHGPPQLQVEAPGAASQSRAQRAVAKPSQVQGLLVDQTKGRPVAGARIFARGTAAEARSGRDGTFAIALPVGARELTVIHPGFGTERVAVAVRPDGSTPLVKVALVPAAVQLADYTVTAPRIVGGTASLLAVRREAATVADIIGAEQMAKSGDSDAAAALGRVPGITVVGGRYVYIRGLGERYSATLLNGSTLPSPEPERRVVPLDLFPVGVLEEITVQKTYTPDLPGDFSGGMVKLQTRGLPVAFTARLGASIGLNDVSALRQATGHEVGSRDWLTLGASDRQLPDAVRAAGAGQQIQPYNRWTGTGLTDEQLEALGEAMPNSWGIRQRTLPPDLGLSGTLGDSFALGHGRRAGYLVSLGYGDSWRRRVKESLLPNVAVGANQALEVFDNLSGEELLREVKLSAIGSGGVDLAAGRGRLRLTGLVVRVSEDETRLLEGFDRDLGADKRGTRGWYRERMLAFGQLGGEHELLRLTGARRLGLRIDWRYALSTATLDEPDRRSTRYDEVGAGGFALSSRPDGNQRFYSELQDLNHDLSIDLTGRLRQWAGLETAIKAGLSFAAGSREVDTRRFNLAGRPADGSVLSLPPEQLFVPRHIGGDGFTFSESTRGTDNYGATQQLWGLYLMADLPLLRPLSLLLGARLERMARQVLTVDPFDADARPIYGPCARERIEHCTEPAGAVLDLLPAATLSYRPWGAEQVFRLGYSRTLNRPQVRELSPAPFDDPDTGIQYEGNPRLQRAILDSVDLRWEWYPSRTETISLSAFYKRFTAPIEVVAITSAAVTVTPDNAEGANNLGLELEVRKKLGSVHRRLRDVTLGGNASVIFSRVELDPTRATAVTSLSRPLQGQSPWVLNLFASYDNVDSGTVVRALYNVFGPRISAVGTNGVPDTLEQPYHRLDLVASQRLGRHLSLSLQVQNLIDHRAEWRLTDARTGRVFVVDGYRLGRVFSLGLSADY